MASTFTPDKVYELMQTGQNNGIWGTKLNANFSIIDLNFGGWLSKSVAGSSNITVSADEAQNVFHDLTGALTGNIQYILPNKGSFYFIRNSTTGAFTITIDSLLNGTGVVVAAGTIAQVFVDSADSAVVSLIGSVANQSANTIYAGPASGGAAAPAFRALVAADIPAGIIPLTGLATQAADTFLANATSGSASPTAIALSASQLAGRGASGDITAITLGTGLSMSGTTLNSSSTAPTRILINTQYFAAGTSTYTPTAGANKADFILVGAGGGGGGGAISTNAGSSGTTPSSTTVSGYTLTLTANGGAGGGGGSTGSNIAGIPGAQGTASSGTDNLTGAGSSGGGGGHGGPSGAGSGAMGGSGGRCIKTGVDISGGGTATVVVRAGGAPGSAGGGAASDGASGGDGYVMVMEWTN